MKKGAKRKGASKAGRKGPAVDESQKNDEVVAESLEETQQPKEDVVEENGEAETWSSSWW
uniref:Uncharacterized protein n=1 Tax=Brassica oleracea TaxID=3712 RepID=A0A3P6A8E1_BRAOL|nr:unnamed protein product [Brassica oleracea]